MPAEAEGLPHEAVLALVYPVPDDGLVHGHTCCMPLRDASW